MKFDQQRSCSEAVAAESISMTVNGSYSAQIACNESSFTVDNSEFGTDFTKIGKRTHKYALIQGICCLLLVCPVSGCCELCNDSSDVGFRNVAEGSDMPQFRREYEPQLASDGFLVESHL